MINYSLLIHPALSKIKDLTRVILIAVIPFMNCNLHAAHSETLVHLKTGTGTLEGSLLVPTEETHFPVALIIAGSGPTDRDGNQPSLRNNSLLMLAEALSKNGIATLRYDKRGVGKSREAGGKEIDMRFEQFISDAKDWIRLLKEDNRFSDIVVIGHSEGSLLGMVASQEGKVDKFISIAGPGKSADKIIAEQLQSQPPAVSKLALPVLYRLRQGETIDQVPPMLRSLFRPSVQPYMISWFRYDPAKELAKLEIPVLIIQGSTDIQVSEQDAQLLAEAIPDSSLKIIQGMNHIFKKAESDRAKNIATYNQPDMQIMPELVETITGFIKDDDD